MYFFMLISFLIFEFDSWKSKTKQKWLRSIPLNHSHIMVCVADCVLHKNHASAVQPTHLSIIKNTVNVSILPPYLPPSFLPRIYISQPIFMKL